MKKFIMMAVCALALCVGFTACSDDDGPSKAEVAEKAEGKANFERMFYTESGKLDDNIIRKDRSGDFHYVLVMDNESPIRVYERILGDYVINSVDKENNVTKKNGVPVSGTYERRNKTMNITLKGNYKKDKNDCYATMTVNFNKDIKTIKFYQWNEESSENLTPFQ